MTLSHNSQGVVLPWPDCLGTFDEESCRFFLRELGRRVVRFYPFSVGIEEVYSQIVDEYGLDGAPDAISVLQELLEDDSTAAGDGDDGDVWRSWRHSWRHRNDDLHNPCVPRVRGQFLRPPTSTRIRLLKSANFAAYQQSQADDTRQSQKRLSFNLQSNVAASRYHSETGRSQRLESQDPTSTLQEYQAPLLKEDTFRRQSPRTSSASNRSHTRELSDEALLLSSQRYDIGVLSTATVSPRQSMPASSRVYPFPFDLSSSRRRTSTRSPRLDVLSTHGVDVIPEEDSDDLRSPAPSLCRPLTASLSPEPEDAITRQTTLSAFIGAGKDNRYSLPSDLGSTDHEGTPNRRRAAHRQARMIDGALFPSKSTKSKFIEGDGTDSASPAEKQHENPSVKVSGNPALQSPRRSWLHGVLTRFRGEHTRSSKQPKLRKRHSSLTSCGIGSQLDSSMSRPHKANVSRIADMKQVAPAHRFGLDGSGEDHHRNKPLPLSPADYHRPSLQSDIQRDFFARQLEPVLLNSDASASSSSHAIVHKESYLGPLVSATMSGPHELSPKEKSWANRFSSSSSRSGPLSPSSFATFANKNPHHDSSEPSTPTVSAPPPLVYQKHKISSDEWPFRGPRDTSQRDATEESECGPGNTSQRQHDQNRQARGTTMEKDRCGERGRQPSTPMWTPGTLHLGLQNTPPKTPPPRSRSPVKRFMGMVKSMSTNQLPDATTPTKQDPAVSANKRKWKELSNKFRNGFLTADLEQLEQEQMMEQYSTDGDVQILTPPPSRHRARFPVSIKSSGQSKLWSELEYMLIETCNTFLKEELENGRLSRDSIIRSKRQWQARNRPQIIEFYYDQATQYDVVIANLRTIKLYSDYAEDAVMLNSVLCQWKILIRELSVKTLCMPDSIVRRWLHDGRRVLELLGATPITLAHFDRLSGLCFAVFGSAEKQRAKQRGRADTNTSHRRSASDGSQNTLWMHEQALMNSGTESSIQPPPMPTTKPTASVTRKVTPQEHRIAQQARKSMDRERFQFTGGNGYSRSLTPAEERSRFMID